MDDLFFRIAHNWGELHRTKGVGTHQQVYDRCQARNAYLDPSTSALGTLVGPLHSRHSQLLP